MMTTPLPVVLAQVRDRILDPKFGGINDTFWMSEGETVVDFINAALAATVPEVKETVPSTEAVANGAEPGTHPVERLWREVGLPEYFLGNGGTNLKLYALYDATEIDSRGYAVHSHSADRMEFIAELASRANGEGGKN